MTQQPSFTSFFRKILLPLRVLRYGHIPLVLYNAALILCSLLAVFAAINGINTQAGIVQYDLDEPSWRIELVRRGLVLICWFVMIPVTVTAFALSTRSVWLNKEARLSPLIAATPSGLITCIRAGYLGLRASLWHFIPLAGMIFLYYTYIEPTLSEDLVYLYLGLTFLVGLACLCKVMPLLMAPVLALAGDCSPQQAVYWGFSLLAHKRASIAIAACASIAACAGLFYGAGRLHLSPAIIWRLKLAVVIFGEFYLVSILTGITLEALLQMVAQQQQAQPAAEPAPLQAPAAAQYQPQSLSADFKVTRVWVEK